MKISDFTEDSKPREKLLTKGPEALSDPEILAILLGSGTKDKNVLELSNEILRDNGGLTGLRKLAKEDISRIRGIGPAKTASILAAVELGRRFSKTMSPNGERQKINSAEDVYQYLHYEMEQLDHEELHILILDTKHYITGEERIYKGTINTSQIRIAEIFRKPLLLNAACFILIHNHPSGDPTPSAADIVTTRNIIAAGKTLDLQLMDHVIIGRGSYVSIKSYLD